MSERDISLLGRDRRSDDYPRGEKKDPRRDREGNIEALPESPVDFLQRPDHVPDRRNSLASRTLAQYISSLTTARDEDTRQTQCLIALEGIMTWDPRKGPLEPRLKFLIEQRTKDYHRGRRTPPHVPGYPFSIRPPRYVLLDLED